MFRIRFRRNRFEKGKKVRKIKLTDIKCRRVQGSKLGDDLSMMRKWKISFAQE